METTMTTRPRIGRRQDSWTAVALFLITLLTRLPFRSQILYHWDSVNFAYAIREFNVAKEQPQPPGYIVYVWLCRLVDLLFRDANTTMVVISIVASALAVAALFYLGRTMFDRRVGLIAALFLATSPLFWFYGEIALPHALDTLLVVVSAWWLYEVMVGNHGYLYPAVVVLAVAGGVRQQTLLFLLPLILFSLRQVGWKRFVAAGALGAIICIGWFVPLTVLNGGVRAYFDAMAAFSDRFQTTTSVLQGAGWWGIQRNLRKLVMYTLFGGGVVWLPLIADGALRLWRRAWPRADRQVWFIVWVSPAVIYYALIHMGQQGLVFVFLPAVLLAGAYSLVHLLENASRRVFIGGVAALLAVNVGVFCLGPEYPTREGDVRLLTRETLVNSDRYYRKRFETIVGHFPPESTAILASNWHHVEYYLPRYVVMPVTIVAKWELGAGQVIESSSDQAATAQDLGLVPDGAGVLKLVVFDDALAGLNDAPQLTQAMPLDGDEKMDVLTFSADQVVYYGPTFGVREK
jgi:hypothetical protein